jgi:hypothetical protein
MPHTRCSSPPCAIFPTLNKHAIVQRGDPPVHRFLNTHMQGVERYPSVANSEGHVELWFVPASPRECTVSAILFGLRPKSTNHLQRLCGFWLRTAMREVCIVQFTPGRKLWPLKYHSAGQLKLKTPHVRLRFSWNSEKKQRL